MWSIRSHGSKEEGKSIANRLGDEVFTLAMKQVLTADDLVLALKHEQTGGAWGDGVLRNDACRVGGRRVIQPDQVCDRG